MRAAVERGKARPVNGPRVEGSTASFLCKPGGWFLPRGHDTLRRRHPFAATLGTPASLHAGRVPILESASH
ncbi:hypothetical protein Dimus_024799, partial [Dionaea muscipula]